MKIRLALGLGVCLLSIRFAASAIQLGDTRAALIAELGQPTGEIVAGPAVLLLFPRGEVRLQNDHVTAINLPTDEEPAAQQWAETAEAIRDKQLARQQARAREIRLARLNEAPFASLTVAEQLVLWQLFAERFPSIAFKHEITRSLGLIVEEERLRGIERPADRRFADLKARLAESESRAARAEREVMRAHKHIDSTLRLLRFPREPYLVFGNVHHMVNRRDSGPPPARARL